MGHNKVLLPLHIMKVIVRSGSLEVGTGKPARKTVTLHTPYCACTSAKSRLVYGVYTGLVATAPQHFHEQPLLRYRSSEVY
jgi:hypothetical protein